MMVRVDILCNFVRREGNEKLSVLDSFEALQRMSQRIYSTRRPAQYDDFHDDRVPLADPQFASGS